MKLDPIMQSMALPEKCWDPHTPPYYDEQRRAWQVFSREHVLKLVTSPEMFSVHIGGEIGNPTTPLLLRGAWAQDDPIKEELLLLFRDYFHRRAVKELAPVITEIGHFLTNDILLRGEGQFEFTKTLGRLPNMVICRMLGMPQEDYIKIKQWLDELSVSAEWQPPYQEEADRYLQSVLDEHKTSLPQGARPRDIVDEMVTKQREGYKVAGEPLTDWFIVGQMWMMVGAGTETTQIGLGDTLQAISLYGLFDELRNDRSLIPGVIEEGFRCYPPFPRSMGMAKMSVQFGKITVPPYQFVEGIISAANYDLPDDPYAFNMRRAPNKHLTFAHGWRYCLGAELAKSEITIMLNLLCDRFPNLRWDSTRPVRRVDGLVNHIPHDQLFFLY